MSKFATRISPAALMQTIKINLLRRPLFHPETVQDCLNIDRYKLLRMIESGALPFAFEVGNSLRRSEPRILALSVVEQQLGPIPLIGASRNLKLPEVIDLILPSRDIKSTELKRILHCTNDNFRSYSNSLNIVRHPTATDGPNSYTVYSRESVAAWLSGRRIA